MKHFKIFIPFSFFVSLASLSDHSQLLLPAPRECAALLSSHSRQSVTMGVGSVRLCMSLFSCFPRPATALSQPCKQNIRYIYSWSPVDFS